MILETLAGKIEVVTYPTDPESLLIRSENRDSVESVLNGIELVGGASGEDRIFNLEEDVQHMNRFGIMVYMTRVTRTEFIRYLEYEVLNFLHYNSINKMRELRRG